MKSIDEIKGLVTERLKGKFGDFPVVIRESPEDSTTYWVQVYAVPGDMVRKVQDLIFDLQEDIWPEGDTLLLPMVKDVAVTREHYPQYAPQKELSNAAAMNLWMHVGSRNSTRYTMCDFPTYAIGLDASAARSALFFLGLPECVQARESSMHPTNRETATANEDLAWAA